MPTAEPPRDLFVDERLEGDYRYTEASSTSRFGEPIRKCCLWKRGNEQPVSILLLYPLRQRIGAAVVETEGLAGVATPPEHRGRGYVRRLLERTLLHLRERVNLAFLFGVETLYDRFGFVTCLDDRSFTIWVHRTETLGDGPPSHLRPISPSELPLVIDLYNRSHRERSWTIDRDREGWNRIPRHETWSPGSTVYALEEGERTGEGSGGGRGAAAVPDEVLRRGMGIDAYAVYRDTNFGQPRRHFLVQEVCASDFSSARRLLRAIGRRALADHVDFVTIEEPEDSIVGIAARDLGCKVTQRTQRTGGGMGVVLNRGRLLDSLRGELDRRLRASHADSPVAAGSRAGPGDTEAASQAYVELRGGGIVSDDKTLLRLLLGYWSVRDLEARGEATQTALREVLEAWFPGAGARGLLLPYSHLLDRY